MKDLHLRLPELSRKSCFVANLTVITWFCSGSSSLQLQLKCFQFFDDTWTQIRLRRIMPAEWHDTRQSQTFLRFRHAFLVPGTRDEDLDNVHTILDTAFRGATKSSIQYSMNSNGPWRHKVVHRRRTSYLCGWPRGFAALNSSPYSLIITSA